MTDASKPTMYEYIDMNHARYKGRDFYGAHADDLAELNYLRDWKAWAEQTMNGGHVSVGELNEARASNPGRLYCKDCQYCRMPQTIYDPPTTLCTREESRNRVGLFQSASIMRVEGLPCGPHARLFVRKPIEPPRPGFLRRLFGKALERLDG